MGGVDDWFADFGGGISGGDRDGVVADVDAGAGSNYFVRSQDRGDGGRVGAVFALVDWAVGGVFSGFDYKHPTNVDRRVSDGCVVGALSRAGDRFFVGGDALERIGLCAKTAIIFMLCLEYMF